MVNRILLFIDCLGPGGAQRQFVGLASFLKEKGYDVHVVCYFDMPFYNHILDKAGVSHEVVAGAGSHFKRIPAIKKAFDAYNPDVVIAYQETPSLVACVIKMLGAKWKLIVSERNTTQKVGWHERLRFRLYRKADFVVPNSYSQESFITHTFPKLTSKTVTISNFVDLQAFTPAEVKKKNGRVEIVVVASIFASKNTLGFIKALSYLKERTTDFRVRWYGRVLAHQAYLDQCLGLIKEYGLYDYVELLDKTKEIANKYREADLFCLPSFFEGTPNVICEAMACGLPVVCSDVCDNAIYVKENINGWLFDPTLPADIADKLYKAIISSDKTKQEYSEQSRKMAEINLSMDKFTQKYIDLLNQL